MKIRSGMFGAAVLAALAVLAATASQAGPAWGAGFSANPTGVAGQVGGGIAEGQNCGLLLTQSTSQSVQALNSVNCNNGTFHTDNRYFRAYDMTGFPDGFDVCEVLFGVEQAVGAGGVQPITVNVYSNSGAAFPPGVLTLRGSAAVIVPDQSLTILSVPLAAALPAGTTEMILEVFTPDGQTAGHSFFIGSNNLGESGPSYLEAPACGVNTPTPTADIGFANMHIVLDARGSAVIVGPPPVSEVPTLGGWGLALLGVVLAGAALMVLRKRSLA